MTTPLAYDVKHKSRSPIREARAAAEAAEPSGPPALEVEALSFGYVGRPVLHGIGMTVRHGVFTALLGPNGAGKTTLFSLLTRLFDSPDGSIRILGRDPRVEGLAVLRGLGVVFQRETLDLDLTVDQNLRYFAGLQGMPRSVALERIREELATIGMLERAGTRARELNGGDRRKVEIARMLLTQPKLLLLDEPTVGLDVPSRKAIVRRVHELATERGVGVLWATHLIDEVWPDDDLIVLHKGRITAQGPVRKVIRETGKRTLAAAFDALSGATPTKRRRTE